MSLEQQLTDAIAAQNNLTQAVVSWKGRVESATAAQQEAFETWKSRIHAAMPVTPNLLVDTKRFSKLCGGGGGVNIEQDLLAAHSGPWCAFIHDGTQATGKIKIVTMDKLAEAGIAYGGDLARTTNEAFYGADYRVALLDVTITKPMTRSSDGAYYVLNQGCPTFTGWHRGEFVTEASCFINVLDCSGTMRFYPHSNMPAEVRCDAADAGKGWIYRRATKFGWGGCHQPIFYGIGHMRVALALPYIGYGDHGNNYVWAGSVGRYSHEDQIA